MRVYAAAISMAVAAGGSVAADEPFVVLSYGMQMHDEEKRHVIMRGETLSGILRHYFGTDVELDALARDVVRRNPRAFRGGNASRMLAGQVLILPSAPADQAEPDAIYFF